MLMVSNNLASLYLEMGQYEKTEKYNQEALVIREKALGKTHPDYAMSLSNLALVNLYAGQYEKAEKYNLETIGIRINALGKEHPDYATSQHNLANLYHITGQYKKAESLYLESKEIRLKSLGKEHPAYTSSLTNLASLYEMESRFAESTQLMTEALTLSNGRMIKGISYLSEHELAKYATLRQQFGFRLNSYLFTRAVGQTSTLPELSYNQALFEKGFLQQASTRLKILANATPESMALNNDLKSYLRRIAKELTKPIPLRDHLEEMEARANDLEKQLTRTVAGYNEAFRQVQWHEVSNALPANAIALEFIHFSVNFPKMTDSVLYAVLLIRPGTDRPQFIPLFEEKELDHLLNSDKERKADYVNDLYAWADRGMVKLGSEKKSLYELIWAKIEAKGLVGINTIYYSPSGVLHRLNLGAIAVDEETILSDRYNMVALNSTRQLVIPAIVNAPANNALLVGGVNFEADTLQSALEETPLISSRSSVGSWSEAGTRGGSWSSLTWTGKEVERISTTLTTSGFTTTKYTGAQATEEAIKAIGSEAASPRILHIATHGFFFPDPLSVIGHRSSVDMDNEPVFKSSDNPMIRSGLILAGGNYAWQNGRPVSPDREDGILTAYEISQMNLSNTELVVLSACETGLGDIQGNEGVYGLQRAFKIAGAKYLIMSLWQVPDRETMEFMTTFYKNWLEEKLTIPDAFRKTHREMRDRFFNPYTWAAFVLVE
jgi:CHAT domain-containing protein